MRARVVVTGLGVVSSIGIGISEFWKAALAGQSGISAITSFAPFAMDGYRSKVAGQVRDFSIERFLDSAHGARVDRYAQFALVSTKEALADSGLQMTKEDPHRVGVIVGAGMGGMVMGEREVTQLYEQQKPHRVHPNFIPTITLNSASGIIAMAYGAKGPNLTISTACSSSAHALGQALHCIREGRADVVIVVGADASITPLVFAGFCSLRALSSKFNDQPKKASRPFEQSRDGFVMGEGAGTLILESASHAKKRKARIYAEVAGYAATSEAYHMVIPREDGLEVAHTMKLALEDAGLSPAHVDYINAHATSTTIGDAVEAKAIRLLFKSRANKIFISATKSLIGHTLGAAGAIGGIASVLSLQTGQIHPTANYEDPDPACALAGLSRSAQERRVKVALLNAFGFGSNNAAVVFKHATT
ncbi:MAG: beta-ketoacyl-ACP synthase II [Nitrospiraceae bacterium]|jgi:3-oxoacyl-[acyl-carrier-protein] synthase II|nr:beta-ketoacyl-ACP synthase II [Nitrospira sp.]MDW7648533.1 beta-ketoacyl-ACP synthase II [Nitrospiraceae bacterium]PHX90646.1 MAG: beta-ketoacyl-[acyl-carrier-protein] synthase II [Nitrospirota bacterium]MBP0121441.1 beta-ketoacyl-ACP synthase II [Nitrospira sp.]MBP0124982.1 beta-ketoacyl-ACP synthase II [Nitrospira sp.]